jgi:hypothetical protein
MTNPPAADQTCFGHLILEFDILKTASLSKILGILVHISSV